MATQHYLTGEYDYWLVTLSVLIAVFASYTALDLAGRIYSVSGSRRYGWLAGGAIAMGTGVWAMHFVAMLAFELPMEMGYDLVLTGLSWLMAVVAAATALCIVGYSRFAVGSLLGGGAFMAIAIGGMHYTGMYAMRMEPGIVYDPWLVALSLAIAFGAALASLWLGFTLRRVERWRGAMRKLGAAALLGAGIVGTHFTGMAAARFPVGSVSAATLSLDSTWLAMMIGLFTSLLLGVAVLSALLDRRLENETAQLVHSLSRANADLLHLSLHDPLTNLANRALLQDRIEQSLERWRRNDTPFAVVYVDLDGFKAINDNLGHKFGDELLVRVARTLTDAVRSADTVARIGGDEFILVANDIAGPDAVALICEKLLVAVTAIDDHGVRLSASLGFALCPDDAQDASHLITAADAAMYAAKSSGRNGYQRYRPDMSAELSEEFLIQTELRAAIAAGELVVYYQPKYTARRLQLVGAEALVRWPHPERGMIPPDRFIYIAEKCGLIVDLEIAVLESVCGQIRAWLDAGLEVPPVSVNLSAVRMRDKRLPEQVESTLRKHRVDPSYLWFEITESLAIDDVLQAIRTLNRFNDMGVHFALDDFGTGHSSLSYLKQLPIQQLKIDRSFIRDLAGDDADQTEIVRSIIGLAHALGLRVVAEGVETREQLDHLGRFDCDEVQGFLLGHPVPAAEYGQRLISEFSREA